MMNYIPGQIEKELQNSHYFLVESDFTWIYCYNKRYSDFTMDDHWTKNTKSVYLKKGDILLLKYFRYGNSVGSPSVAYCYIEKVIVGSTEIVINSESTISRSFLVVNSKIFNDVTKMMERNNKIENILEKR